MPTTCTFKKNRNQMLEFCKLCASVLVVFIHFPFPGGYGQALSTLALIAVPFFFSVSGYFCYNVDKNVIGKRLKYILKLNLIGSLIYMFSNWFFAAYSGVPFEEYMYWDSIFPRMPALLQWLTLHVNPFSEPLWYLTALLICYLYVWIYLNFHKEKPVDYSCLYLIGTMAFFVLFFFGSVTPLAGFAIPYNACRNGWVFGPAMFMMGMFIHQYQEVFLKELKLNNWKLLLIFLIGIVLTLGSWKTKAPVQLPIGTVIQIPSLLLLCVANPKISLVKRNRRLVRGGVESIASHIGSVYTAIYILHMAVGRFYNTFLHPAMERLLGIGAQWIQPVCVLLLSLLSALLWIKVERLLRLKK